MQRKVKIKKVSGISLWETKCLPGAGSHSLFPNSDADINVKLYFIIFCRQF